MSNTNIVNNGFALFVLAIAFILPAKIYSQQKPSLLDSCIASAKKAESSKFAAAAKRWKLPEQTNLARSSNEPVGYIQETRQIERAYVKAAEACTQDNDLRIEAAKRKRDAETADTQQHFTRHGRSGSGKQAVVAQPEGWAYCSLEEDSGRQNRYYSDIFQVYLGDRGIRYGLRRDEAAPVNYEALLNAFAQFVRSKNNVGNLRRLHCSYSPPSEPGGEQEVKNIKDEQQGSWGLPNIETNFTKSDFEASKKP